VSWAVPRRWHTTVGALLVAAALAGCTSIPTSGPVVVGQSVGADPRDGVLQPILEGPRPGATPVQVVRGFIRAAVGFADDHKVARTFLAPSRRLAWSPDPSVAVYSVQSALRFSDSAAPASTPAPSSAASAASAGPAGSSAAVPAGDERVTVTVRAPVSGTIDAAGRYTVALPGAIVQRRFGLVRSEGEWRVDKLDDGILVSASDFSVTFRSFPVYFSDPAGRYLVPDVHWLPGTRDSAGTREVPTALVRALLEGPPRYLQGAVVSGAPPGTRMAVASVVVSDQVATVDLTEDVRRASARERQLLLTQLRATLNLGAISGVEITVRRTPLDIPADQGRAGGAVGDPAAAADGVTRGQPQADPQVDDDPVVVDREGHLARLVGRTLSRVRGVEGLAVPGVNRPAVNAERSAYAALTGDRSQLLLQLPSAKVSAVVRGRFLTAPSFDPWGWVWTSDVAARGWVSAARPEPGRVKVSARWLTGMEVVTLRISREGSRALVAIRVNGQAHVFVAGVVRDDTGQPVSLTQPLGVLPDLTTVVDASWVDEDQIVVLGRRLGRAQSELPWVAQLGGLITATAPVKGGRTISAANGVAGLMVGTIGGTLTQVGSGWGRVTTARWAAYPG
jgi:Lipoprotein LpqB beta-propeller domain/Sporulation and spore germination